MELIEFNKKSSAGLSSGRSVWKWKSALRLSRAQYAFPTTAPHPRASGICCREEGGCSGSKW